MSNAQNMVLHLEGNFPQTKRQQSAKMTATFITYKDLSCYGIVERSNYSRSK